MSIWSRRECAFRLAAFVATLRSGSAMASQAGAPLRLGLNTYSLRGLTADDAIPIILETMHEARLEDCQLWARHVEPARFQAPYPGPDDTPTQLRDRQEKADALSAWRLAVPLSYFENIRVRFHARGVRIRSYSVGIGSTPAEMERQFLMARALGAEALIARVPEPLTAAVAMVAGRQQLMVGLQFADAALLRRQLEASPWFRADPDIGDLARSGVDALQFIQHNYSSLLSVDLKDAVPGGVSVPFGQGAAHMREVLRFLRDRKSMLTAYIDCDYEGTGKSGAEVRRSIDYARRCLAS